MLLPRARLRWVGVFSLLVGSFLRPTAGCDLASCCCDKNEAFALGRSGSWHVVDSPNFQVCSATSGLEAMRVARRCERLRAQLIATWNGDSAPWSPRCQVALHSSIAGYQRAVGPGGASTLGASLVTPTRGKILCRRIDLRTDVADLLTAALPHEVCHLVIADHFRDAPPPLWFDEGLAIQYDPAAKRRLHERDCRRALLQGVAFPLASLLAENAYPRPEQWGIFYGQSGSIVRWLLGQRSPRRLLQLAKRPPTQSLDDALRQNYGLPSVAALDRGWRTGGLSLSDPLPAELALPGLAINVVASR